MPTIPTIHIILPAFNEATVIEEVIKGILAVLACVIVVVDDGSDDETAQRAKAAGAIVVKHPLNRGAGAACQTGISLARKYGWQRVAFMDADGQHSPEDLLRMLEAMETHQADLVIGSRFQDIQNNVPAVRRFFNAAANVLTNSFCTHHYSDTQSGFRLLNYKAIQTINLLQDDFSYCSEMIILSERASLKVVEVPIKVKYTVYSISKGQDFQVGLLTAFHFLWKLFFK